MCSLFISWVFILLLFAFSVGALKEFETLKHLKPKASQETQAAAAQALIGRIVGKRANEFKASISSTIGPENRDTFQIITSGSYVNITGTTGVAVAMGLYYYLTNHCGCQYTWAGQQMDIPSTLPNVPSPGIKITTNDRFRYFQNVCTVDYSFVWYNWPEWEQQLDWMALHGINMPLAFTGQEAIFQRIYMRMGFTMYDIQRHFGGPAFLAWSRMGNMHGWGGPLPQSWIDQQLVLQHKILDRARELGMIPVLPGFAGHVPEAITWLYPESNVSRLPDWAGFNGTYCCNLLLDFDDPLFKQIGVQFLKELMDEFGTDHIYNIDTFNEMDPKSNDPVYLAKASRTIYDVVIEADPNGIWLMQGWLFQAEYFWKPDQIKAYLTGVPTGKMMILDLYSEIAPIFTRTQSYYGQPFIWCMLHNFGGTSEMYGAFLNINNGPFDGRAFPDSTMVGLGITPEGIYQNEVIYEFFAENIWRTGPRDVTKWVTDYATRRYGKYDKYVDLAWHYLKLSIYNCSDGHHDNNLDIIPTVRPRLTPMIHQDLWYEPEDLYVAWDILVLAADQYVNSTLYMYDLVDVTRNSLQILGLSYYQDMINAYKGKDLATVTTVGAKLLGLLKDMDTALASDPHFLMGRWIAAAQAKSTNLNERILYEYNARNQVTLWGPGGEILDYACKQWAGLIEGYYRPRWELFVETLKENLQNKTDFNQGVYDQTVLNKVEIPFTYDLTPMATEPKGDSLAIVKDIHMRYRPDASLSGLKSLRRKSSKGGNQDWSVRKYGKEIVPHLRDSKYTKNQNLRDSLSQSSRKGNLYG
ncbi:alpha-N-acetylglucosaminidase-like [Argopecten irradians]|uniref:alpha-N-acetylglucosaminidase-like n=1 Tax=Argopecten irradians TaxID=31199 RepID=UPI0037118A28